MAATMNKRQIARNEKALQELLKQPGNDRCADCFTRNPGWASWSLGVFLCVRCASLHRKLGTHISKVKSLSMDAWTSDQVEAMKRTGNVVSNRRYNPRSQKPNIPIDADEIDSAMERFIREKYQHKTLSGEGRPLPTIKHHTGSSDSSNDIPPPLPPKNGPRMGPVLRSQSSTYPSQAPLPSPPASDWGSSGSRSGDVRRMGGIPETVAVDGGRSSFDIKLDRLRDMGFSNQARNTTILKGCTGDFDKAVETLTRLGEGYGNVLPRTRPTQTNGISFESAPATASTSPQHTGMSGGQIQSRSPSSASNPFARHQPTQSSMSQQSAQSQPQAATSTLNQAFQNMTVTQQPTASAPLFPHNTGTWSSQQQPSQSNPFMKTFTPPITPSPSQLVRNHGAQQADSNPFLRSVRSQTFASPNPFLAQATGSVQATPTQQHVPNAQLNQYAAPQDFFNQHLSQATQQPQGQMQYQNFQSQPVQSPGVMHPTALHPASPFAHSPAQPQSYFGVPHQSQSYPLPQQQQHQHQQQQQQHSQQQHPFFGQQAQPQSSWQYQTSPSAMPQSAFYRNKDSILSLYGPSNPYQDQQQAPTQPMQNLQQAQQLPQPQRSATMPASSMTGVPSSNPFANLAGNAPAAGPGHVSRDSMLFTGQGLPGRSASPDAFSGLSARLG